MIDSKVCLATADCSQVLLEVRKRKYWSKSEEQ